MSMPSEEPWPASLDPDASNYQQSTTSNDPDASAYEQLLSTAEFHGLPPLPQRGRNLPRAFGDYELLAEIARGGMGVVYKARELKPPQRTVALKMILGGEHAAEGSFERFRREASLTADWDHAGIVRIYEVGERDGQPFYTMPLIEGGSLQHLVQARGPLPPKEAARLVHQLSEAVQYAHERGVIHRDIKPHNVLLASGASNGPGKCEEPGPLLAPLARTVPKLTDFGLARTREGGQSVTGELLGTPSYMSPEQAAGKVRDVSPRSDVYSLGAVLYCLLTGRPPFQSGSAMETMRLVLEREAVPVRVLNPSVPRDLETVCLKCLEKTAEKRYTSARELADELGRFERGEPVVARPVAVLEKAWRWCKRKPVIAGLSAAVGALIVFATVLSLVMRAKAEKLAGEKTIEAARATEAKEEAKGLQKDAERERDHLAYLGQLRLAERHWEQGNVAAARDSLEQARALALSRASPGETVPWELDYLHGVFAAPERTFLGHIGPVRSASFSPDGTRIVSLSEDKTLKVWDAQTGQELYTLPGHTRGIENARLSPDGTRIVTGSMDQTLKVWDARTGQELRTLKGHTAGVWSVSFSPDGKRIVSGSYDQMLKVWDAQTGRELFTRKGSISNFSPDSKRIVSRDEEQTLKVWDAQTGQEHLTLQGHLGIVSSLSYSPDGTRILSASEDRLVKVWDARTGQELHTLRGHTTGVTSASYSPDGSRIISIGMDHKMKLWDAQTGQDLHTLSYTDYIASLSFSPDGKRFVCGSGDNTLKLRDARTGQELVAFKGHTSPVSCLSFSPDGKSIVSGSGDSTLKLWDVQTGQDMFVFKGHTGGLYSVRFSPDGKRIVSASDDQTLKVWDAISGQELLSLKGDPGGTYCANFSPDGKRIVSGGHDQTLKVWDAQTGASLLTLKGHTDVVNSVSFSPDGTRIVSGSWDKTLKLWDAQTGRELLTLEGHKDYVRCASFSPDGMLIVSGSDRTLKVWDARTGQSLRTIKGHASEVNSVSFSPDQQRIVSAGEDQVLKVWDAQSGQALLTLKGHTSGVTSAGYSPDGKRIVSGSMDQTLKLWDARTGEPLLTLKGHTLGVLSVSFSPDGRRIASGGDTTLRTWDAQTGQELFTLKGHSADVRGVSFSPDAKRIVSASWDRTLKLWDAQTGQDLRTFEGHSEGFNSVSFSPDATRIVSTDIPGKTLVWETATGKRLDEPVPAAHVSRQTSPDGRTLVLADGNVVRVFGLRDAGALETKAMRLKRMAQPDPAWHGEQVRDSVKTGNCFAAAFHLGWLTRIESQQPHDSFSRRESAFHVRLLQGSPEAISSAWADLASHPAAPAAEKFGSALYLGRFAPLTEEHARRLVRMADELVRKQRSDAHLDYLGFALYRASHYEAAARTLEESVKLQGEGGYIHTKLFLALSCKQLGRDEEARRHYAEFAEWYKDQPFGTWQEQVRWQRLNEEARRLIFSMLPAAEGQ